MIKNNTVTEKDVFAAMLDRAEEKAAKMRMVVKGNVKFLIRPVKDGYFVNECHRDAYTKRYEKACCFTTKNLDFLEW